MLRQAIAALDDCAAAVAKCTACPEGAPSSVVENLRGSGVSLVESRNDTLAGHQRFVSGKTTGGGAIEEGFLQSVLEAAADSDALQLTDVEHQFGAFGAGGGEVDGDKDAGGRSLGGGRTSGASGAVGAEVQPYTRVRSRSPSCFEI